MQFLEGPNHTLKICYEVRKERLGREEEEEKSPAPSEIRTHNLSSFFFLRHVLMLIRGLGDAFLGRLAFLSRSGQGFKKILVSGQS